MPQHVKVAGAWRTIDNTYIKVAGAWKVAASNEVWVKVNGSWRQEVDQGLPAGQYTLSASSKSIPSSVTSSAWALFDTTQYVGRITQADAQISYQ